MSDVSKQISTSNRSVQTMSFGSHRLSDRPASALRAGASSMPSTWQSRGVPTHDGSRQYGASVRSFGDIALDPLRWAVSTKFHGLCCGAVAGVFLLILAL